MDYHENTVQVCVLEPNGDVLMNAPLPNDWQRIEGEAGRHGRIGRAAIEACTGSANLAQELIDRAGWKVELAHPGYVSRMKKGPDKTDFGDGRLLADLTRVGYLPTVWLAPENIRELRRLTRYRQQMADRRRDVKLRISALLRENRVKGPVGAKGPVSAWTRVWMRWLKGVAFLPEQSRWVMDRHLEELEWTTSRIEAAEERLAAATAEDPVVGRLLTFMGIGKVTAWVMRAEIGRFDRFADGKQLSRYCGLSPCNASSGMRQSDSGLVRAGNPALKSLLIEAGQRLMRWEGRWKELGRKLRSAGKPGSVAAAAVANRWVRWLYYRMVEEKVEAPVAEEEMMNVAAREELEFLR
jgi:transposase